MKRLKVVIMLVILFAGSAALAGSDYDACRREENRLLSEEADRCGGWNYVLNPSACFNARKALAPYNKGKCGELAPTEKGVGKASQQGTLSLPPGQGSSAAPGAAGQSAPVPSASGGVETHSSDLAELRREVAELRSEVERLKAEISRLKGGK